MEDIGTLIIQALLAVGLSPKWIAGLAGVLTLLGLLLIATNWVIDRVIKIPADSAPEFPAFAEDHPRLVGFVKVSRGLGADLYKLGTGIRMFVTGENTDPSARPPKSTRGDAGFVRVDALAGMAAVCGAIGLLAFTAALVSCAGTQGQLDVPKVIHVGARFAVVVEPILDGAHKAEQEACRTGDEEKRETCLAEVENRWSVILAAHREAKVALCTIEIVSGGMACSPLITTTKE